MRHCYSNDSTLAAHHTTCISTTYTAITFLATQLPLRLTSVYCNDSITCITIRPAQLYQSNSYPSPYPPHIPGNPSFVTPFVYFIFIRNTGLCCFNVALRTILISYLTRTPCSHSYPTITAIHSLSQTYPSHSHTHSHPSVFLSYSEKRLI